MKHGGKQFSTCLGSHPPSHTHSDTHRVFRELPLGKLVPFPSALSPKTAGIRCSRKAHELEMARLRCVSGRTTLIGMKCTLLHGSCNTGWQRQPFQFNSYSLHLSYFIFNCRSSKEKVRKRLHTFGYLYHRHLQPQGHLFSCTSCRPHALGWYLYQASPHSIKLQHLNLLFCTLLAEGCKCFMSRWACSITILLEGWISFLQSWVTSEVVLSL